MEEAAHDLLLRLVPQRQEAQSTVGFLLWGSATVLCNWLCRQPRGCWHGKRVLEIGAGLGLVGLLAAQRCTPKEIVMTDFQRDILENLKHNVALNFGGSSGRGDGGGGGEEEGSGVASAAGPSVLVRKFDWDEIDGHAWARDRFDVIIGSDLICEASNGRGVTRSLRRLLKPGGHGVAYLVNPTAHSRWSMEYFKEQLNGASGAASGCAPTVEESARATAAENTFVPLTSSVRAVTGHDGLLDGVFDRDDVHYEFYDIRSV